MATTSGQSSSIFTRNVLIGVSFAVGLTLGVLGVFLIQHLKPQNEQSSQDVARSESQQTSTKSTESSESTVTERLVEVFHHRNVIEQNKALYSILSSASEEELGDWWIQSQKIERDSHREIAQDGILRHLTAINPQIALTYIEEISVFQSEEPIRSVFSEWSLQKLDEAIKAANTLSSSQRRVALEAILETRDDLPDSRLRTIAIQLEGEETFLKLVSDASVFMSTAEPKESWEILLNDDVTDYLQLDSLTKVAEAWHEQIGLEVLSKIYHSEIDDLGAKYRLVSTIAQLDFHGALDYTRGLDVENERSFLASTIARAWARTDAQTALAAVSTFESLSSNLELQIARIWAQTKPYEVIESIETLSEEVRIETLEKAFSEIADQDPLEAIEKLNVVEKFVANASSIVQRIVNSWARQQPDTAMDWVLSNYSPDDQHRHLLLATVLHFLAPKDPDRSFEIASANPSTSMGIKLESLVIRRIAHEGDFDVAKKFLTRVKVLQTHEAYAVVGQEMVAQGQYSVALELGEELPETNQLHYYYEILNHWAQYEPRVLYDSLDDLSTNHLKSWAALQLIMKNRYEPSLTEEQISHARTLLISSHQSSLEKYENR
ncbi:MAG: hypothetical protein F4W92_08705 [Gammaproteobacteria bacterium]|nr:hypothetical protein [Gammaproteobacteria bacterium]